MAINTEDKVVWLRLKQNMYHNAWYIPTEDTSSEDYGLSLLELLDKKVYTKNMIEELSIKLGIKFIRSDTDF